MKYYWLNCKTCDAPLCNVVSDTQGELLGNAARSPSTCFLLVREFHAKHSGHELEERKQ